MVQFRDRVHSVLAFSCSPRTVSVDDVKSYVFTVRSTLPEKHRFCVRVCACECARMRRQER